MSKAQGMSNDQAPKRATLQNHWGLGMVAWDFFGTWALGFGHSALAVVFFLDSLRPTFNSLWHDHSAGHP
jgi:hypothetical protein